MRKLFCALMMSLFMAGLVVAADVTVTGYDPATKAVKVKDGDNEKTYKLTDKTKVTVVDKDGNEKEANLDQLAKRLSFVGKGKGKGKGGMKLDVTTEGDNITAVKMKAFGGKGKGKKKE